MEQSSCHNSKVGTYLLRSTVAKKEEPEGHIHVVAAILHTPLHAGLLQLSACADRNRSRGTLWLGRSGLHSSRHRF